MAFNLTTFVFEIVNFLVLLLVLHRLVYRPLRRGIDARRLEQEAEAAALEAQKQAVVERAAELDSRAKELDQLRFRAVREASEAASEERARILEQAHEDAAADRRRAQRLLEAEHEAALVELKELAVERSTALAGRLLLELAPGAVEGALVDLLVIELGRRAPMLKELVKDEPTVEVELTWARLPSDAERNRVREALAKALERPVKTTHVEDDTLLGGVRARVENRVLDATVAGELDLVRERVRAQVKEVS